MTDTVIKVDNLSKRYIINHQALRRAREATLRDAVLDGFRAIGRRFTGGHAPDPTKEAFWALRDVSFQVSRGDRVGVIGRNGAGKSTLLKVLSRITEPSRGRVAINGRVASLLEVGTGFHAELSGRENIFLNGAILGMSKAEIKAKFDEIVDFSEVERFLDTPVKRYSSGMYVRLAFAVAAYLEPEILIVDEVLAVGDAEFQKKCLGRMQDIAENDGRTILFVSHNMAAVQSLCTRAILMKQGQCVGEGTPDEIISLYVQSNSEDRTSLATRTDRRGTGQVIVTDIRVLGKGGVPVQEVHCGDDVVFEIDYENRTGKDVDRLSISMGFYDLFGRAITFIESVPLGVTLSASKDNGTVRCRVPKFRFAPGRYWASCNVGRWPRELFDGLEHGLVFDVLEGDFFGEGKLTHTGLGGVLVEQEWSQ